MVDSVVGLLEFMYKSVIVKDLEETELFGNNSGRTSYNVVVELVLRSKPFKADYETVYSKRHTGYSVNYGGTDVGIYEDYREEKAVVPAGVNFYDSVVAYLDGEKVGESKPKVVEVSRDRKYVGDGDYELTVLSAVEYKFKFIAYRFDEIPDRKTAITPVKLRLDLYHGQSCVGSMTRTISHKIPFMAKDILVLKKDRLIKAWERGEVPPNHEFKIEYK